MDIYSLTPRGSALAHSYRYPESPAWKVIFFLSKRGYATSDVIYQNVPESNRITLAKLSRKGIITSGRMATMPAS